MNLRKLLVLALITSTIQPIVFAQEQGGRRRGGGGQGEARPEGAQRGPGGPGGGFGGPGGMMGMMGGMMGAMGGMGGGGPTQLLGMLGIDEVRKELGLTDDVYQAVQASQGEIFGKMRGMRDASEGERAKMREEANTASQELLDEVLTPEKQKRLLGIMVQIVGPPAVMNPSVAKEIGLSESAIEAIRKEMESFGEKAREQFTALRSGGEFPDIAKIQEMITTMREEVNAAVESKLTDANKKSLEALKGEKFELPDNGPFGMFGRGAGGFGGPPRDGAGTRQGRGRQPGRGANAD
ncbi:MAG: hypothetical protein KF752_00460 [Pirellulaceae bacterium]|nr:hypothetical protein [Pirellulaceae bacterium]